MNSALELIGHGAISSFDNDDIGVAVANRYESLKRYHLTNHPWRFAMREEPLSQLADVGSVYITQWQYAYSLPLDYLQARGLVCRGSFEIAGDELYTDLAEDVILRYYANVAESYFHPQFVDALSVNLASDLAISITDNSQRASEFAILANRRWRAARLHDSQMGPNASMLPAIRGAISRRSTRP
jgi:hypothetical protein